MYIVKLVDGHGLESVGFIEYSRAKMEDYVVGVMANGDMSVRKIRIYFCDKYDYEVQCIAPCGLGVFAEDMKFQKDIEIAPKAKFKREHVRTH